MIKRFKTNKEYFEYIRKHKIDTIKVSIHNGLIILNCHRIYRKGVAKE